MRITRLTQDGDYRMVVFLIFLFSMNKKASLRDKHISLPIKEIWVRKHHEWLLTLLLYNLLYHESDIFDNMKEFLKKIHNQLDLREEKIPKNHGGLRGIKNTNMSCSHPGIAYQFLELIALQNNGVCKWMNFILDLSEIHIILEEKNFLDHIWTNEVNKIFWGNWGSHETHMHDDFVIIHPSSLSLNQLLIPLISPFYHFNSALHHISHKK